MTENLLVRNWRRIPARSCAGGAPRRLLAPILALALVLVACGSGDPTTNTTTTEPTSTTSDSTTTTMVSTTTVAPTTTAEGTTTTNPTEATGSAVYFMLDQLEGEDPPGPLLVPVYREVDPSADPASVVVEALLDGPTDDEVAGTPAISTAIPDGTRLLGVSVDGGVATVDLSGEFEGGGGSSGMFARLAQVVFTLTRVPDIGSVTFSVDGELVEIFSSEGIVLDGPQEREDYYDLLPFVFVDIPAWGEPVTSPVEVSGLSNVFEAVSQVMLTDDDGAPLFEDVVMASCGTGCWGEWSIEIPYAVDREQFGALIVWVDSAKDGSRIDIREYPVRLG